MRGVIGDWPDEGKTTAAFITGLEPKHSRRPHITGSCREVDNKGRWEQVRTFVARCAPFVDEDVREWCRRIPDIDRPGERVEDSSNAPVDRSEEHTSELQ